MDTFFKYLVFVLYLGTASMAPSALFALGQIRAGSLSISPACGAPGDSITVTVDLQAATWSTISYGIGFSVDTTAWADPTDTWVVGNSGGICPQAGKSLAQTGIAGWKTVIEVVTVPAGFSGGNIIVVVGQDGMSWSSGACNPDQQDSIAFLAACGTPTPTITPTFTVTPTPSLPLVKSANVAQVAVGDTITFCIAWTNDSSAAMTRTFYDLLVPELTWLGGDSGCTVAGQQVTCSFPAAAGASGDQCFWTVVNAVP